MPRAASLALGQTLRRLSLDLAVLAENPEDSDHAFDLLNTSYTTAAAARARQRLLADPAIAPLVQERYWGPWPSVAELLELPCGSLGHGYGRFLSDQGLEVLPEPVLAVNLPNEEAYLHRRIRHCHDVWHVVAGIPATLAGEAAANGLTTEQLRWPGSALMIAADLLHRVSGDPSTGPDVGVAVAYGLELGAVAAPLLAQRWEEGWERPLASWRQELGIEAVLQRCPFAPLPGTLPGTQPDTLS